MERREEAPREVYVRGLRNKSAPNCYAGLHLAENTLADIAEPLRIAEMNRVEQLETTRANDIRCIHPERKGSVCEENVSYRIHIDVPTAAATRRSSYVNLSMMILLLSGSSVYAASLLKRSTTLPSLTANTLPLSSTMT